MTHHRSASAVVAAVVVALATTSARAQHEHSTIDIGRLPEGFLAFHTHQIFPMPMPASELPGFTGFVMIELAFESLIEPNAHGDLPLLPGADIRIVLDAIDPGLILYNGAVPMVPGDELILGSPFFHFLPVWQIPDEDASGVLSATIHARDAAGLHLDSLEPMIVSFVPIPAPTTGALLVAATPFLLRRRR